MIARIELENWRSHKKTVLEFEKGTNVLVGVMGAGKSSVMDALCFALFGTFPSHNSRKVSLEETILSTPNKAESSKIAAEIECFGKNYRVERLLFGDGRSGQAKLYCCGKLLAGPKPRAVNQEVERVLGIDFELFSRAIYSEQNELDYFLKLAPSQRKKKFDDLLGLDRYEAARAKAASLQNNFKKESLDAKQRLEQVLAQYSVEEEGQAIEKIAKTEKNIIVLEARGEELLALEKELGEKIQKLSGDKKKFELLQQGASKNTATLEELSRQLHDFGEKHPGIELSGQKISKKRGELEEKISGEKKARKNCAELEKAVSSIGSKALFLGEQLAGKKSVEPRSAGELEKAQKENTARLEKIVSEIRQLEEVVVENEKDSGGFGSAIMEMKNFQSELSALRGACPVCKRALDEEHRQKLLAGAGEKIGLLGKQLETAENNLANMRSRKRDLEKKREAALEEKSLLEKSLELLKELSVLENQLGEAQKELCKKNKALLAARPRLSDKELEEMEKEFYFLQQATDALEKQEQAMGLEKKIREQEKELCAIGFDEKELEQKTQELSAKKAEKASARAELSSSKELLKALKSSFEKISALKKEAQNLEHVFDKAGLVAEKLSLFSNALQATQAELRAQLVDAINQAMEDIWPRVYPYKDYSTARIKVDGNDYELYVKNALGEWVRVEGILSGGERSAAALTIRIAFSLVLAGNLSWLILDEPTHNLDRNAVQMLCSMFREHLPELVEQVFVVTHDKELEKAASGTVYELSRNKELFQQTTAAKMQ